MVSQSVQTIRPPLRIWSYVMLRVWFARLSSAALGLRMTRLQRCSA
jgi:hypothetical protein